ncbi:hypothetical protein HELRODRAFT_190992 [Helobdella robusta]|uniref:Protein SHQ1 homolog n=1 Tax=Helobdella robusta TaxID=6412 RepID=T1FSH3_HELRO|nr:hypothetical protein HELRODRAFT_190992 [Helobdella robusta]ESO07605.1 hypothetical protein HELRODRAFT_190992 [Helobdella robusta]
MIRVVLCSMFVGFGAKIIQLCLEESLMYNVESGWTICKLSSTLSWFDRFMNINEVITSCIRRSLIYPLYRNYELSVAVLTDVSCILKRGRKYVLRCLLKIRKLLLDADDHYLLNDLYIDDYCSWIQHAKTSILKGLASEIGKLDLKKSDLGLDVDLLERAADLVVKDGEAGEARNQLVNIVPASGSDSDDDDDDDDDDSCETDDGDDDDDDGDDVDTDDEGNVEDDDNNVDGNNGSSDNHRGDDDGGHVKKDVLKNEKNF